MEPSITNGLQGKRGLVVAIANDGSTAAGCARSFVAADASLAATYLNEKALAHVRPVLDFLLHTIAFAPADDLHGRVVDCSAAGFALAMDVSCHSFLRMARLAEPLMPTGGCLLTVTFYGAERVVSRYNLMGPVKAALESAVRYTAAELGPKGIRAHAISPGPIRTRAASGIDRFDELLAAAAPERHLVDVEDVGALAAFLVSDGARRITGTIIPVDGGQHLMA
jgi:enoyl-[acyl-carrier protein] reductase I